MDIKLRCNFCVMLDGAAIRTDQLYLLTSEHRDYLVCERHRHSTIRTIRRQRYEQQVNLFK